MAVYLDASAPVKLVVRQAEPAWKQESWRARETVTVVFADLVGSTELASRLGHDAYESGRHATWARLCG